MLGSIDVDDLLDPATEAILARILTEWTSVVGREPSIGSPHADRELWPVIGGDGRAWLLKRLSPWRNLPLADEAGVIRHLSPHGVRVPDYTPTDAGRDAAGPPEDAFVLMPRFEAAVLAPSVVASTEGRVGRAVAVLHEVLRRYPEPVDSYVERIAESLAGRLRAPEDVVRRLAPRRDAIASRLESLPTQRVHGDLTPDNVLRSASGGVTGFIDFDHLPEAPRIWDVAKYLSRRVRRPRASDADRVDGLGAFIRGYREVSPLSDAELLALPDAVLVCNVLEVDYGARVLDGSLPRRMLPDHAETLALATEAVRWHLDHTGTVVDALSAGEPDPSPDPKLPHLDSNQEPTG